LLEDQPQKLKWNYTKFIICLNYNYRFNIPFKLINLAHKAHTGLFFTHMTHIISNLILAYTRKMKLNPYLICFFFISFYILKSNYKRFTQTPHIHATTISIDSPCQKQHYQSMSENENITYLQTSIQAMNDHRVPIWLLLMADPATHTYIYIRKMILRNRVQRTNFLLK